VTGVPTHLVSFRSSQELQRRPDGYPKGFWYHPGPSFFSFSVQRQSAANPDANKLGNWPHSARPAIGNRSGAPNLGTQILAPAHNPFV
jgi:hypothetical protein